LDFGHFQGTGQAEKRVESVEFRRILSDFSRWTGQFCLGAPWINVQISKIGGGMTPDGSLPAYSVARLRKEFA
jgi:hypothetical protein